MTPTARSLALLRREGYRVAVVEHWHPVLRCRLDLFGCFDLLAFRPGDVALIQTTTASNLASRRRKVRTTEDGRLLPALEAAGVGVELHGWVKRRGRWTCRREVLTDPPGKAGTVLPGANRPGQAQAGVAPRPCPAFPFP